MNKFFAVVLLLCLAAAVVADKKDKKTKAEKSPASSDPIPKKTREELESALTAAKKEEAKLQDEKDDWEGKHKDKAGDLFKRLNTHDGKMDSDHVMEYLDQFQNHKKHVHKSLKEVQQLLTKATNRRKTIEAELAELVGHSGEL